MRPEGEDDVAGPNSHRVPVQHHKPDLLALVHYDSRTGKAAPVHPIHQADKGHIHLSHHHAAAEVLVQISRRLRECPGQGKVRILVGNA